VRQAEADTRLVDTNVFLSFLLAYALIGRADYLVTGDGDLLTLGQVETLKIVTSAKFVRAVSGV